VTLKEYLSLIGTQIQQLRKSQGYTQEGMEEGDYGIPYRTLQDIERGKSNFTMDSLWKISHTLGVDPHSLLIVSSSKKDAKKDSKKDSKKSAKSSKAPAKKKKKR
jgi:transcriptional regulator with XRE-family HTH domain